jgi:multiple sugar transport system ATP-binding protein
VATVTFDHVWKRFGDVIAVNDLSLDIPDEEFLVLVGPSGCGKTTSLRMIAGLEEVTSGTVKIGDRVVNDLAPKDRDVAMVFQSYALYPHMSVRDNLAFGLKLRKVPKADIERRVAEAAKMLELTPLLDRKPKALSGGQRQRVALGRAIVREPQVFLMDEPLSNLDAKLRVATRAELSRLHQRLRTTIVYVTHDQVEAMTMGTRIAVMNQGILQQVGPPQELYERPMNRFVAGFIGSPAMNFVPMTVTRSDGALKLCGPGLELPAPPRLTDALAGRVGKGVTVGFRPEHLALGDAGPEVATIDAACDVVEYLGNDELLHLQVGELDLVGVVDAAHRVKVGQRLAMRLPLDRIYVFDGETEQAITGSGAAAA